MAINGNGHGHGHGSAAKQQSSKAAKQQSSKAALVQRTVQVNEPTKVDGWMDR